MSDDEVDGSTNPLAEYAESAYLVAAGEWLSTADRLRTSIVSTDPIDEPFEAGITARITKIRDISNFRFESSARLAELNIAMAAACGVYQDRQRPGKTDWLAPTVPAAAIAKTPDEVATEIREQVQADVAAHQAETLRPGIDPEPPEDGALWTADGETFAFSAYPLADGLEQRWLLLRRYVEFLSWQTAPEPKPSPATWEGLDGKIGYADAPLRHPTAAERAAFYGPEPDPTADTHIICPKCGAPGRALEPGERERRTPENDPWCPPCTAPSGKAGDWVGGNVPAVCGKCGGRHAGDCATAAPQVADLWAFTDRAGTAVAELSKTELATLIRTLLDRLSELG